MKAENWAPHEHGCRAFLMQITCMSASMAMRGITMHYHTHMQRNLFQIALNQTQIRLYLPCTMIDLNQSEIW